VLLGPALPKGLVRDFRWQRGVQAAVGHGVYELTTP
jgi:hypothetical protein